MFVTVGRVSVASGAGRIPNWLSTHTAPEDRTERLARRADRWPGYEAAVRQSLGTFKKLTDSRDLNASPGASRSCGCPRR
ncbi:MAG: hypothetical protein ACM3SU_01350 [Acidobacteriota bacterium]